MNLQQKLISLGFRLSPTMGSYCYLYEAKKMRVIANLMFPAPRWSIRIDYNKRHVRYFHMKTYEEVEHVMPEKIREELVYYLNEL